MNLNVFNGCLIAAWLMITVGAACIYLPAGLLTGGVALVSLTLFVGARFGVYQQDEKTKPEGAE